MSRNLLLFPLGKARAALPEFGFTPKLLQAEAILGCGWRQQVPAPPPRAGASSFPLQPEEGDLGEQELLAPHRAVSTASACLGQAQRCARRDSRNQSYAGTPARDWMKAIGAAGSSQAEPTKGLHSLVNACRDSAKRGHQRGRGTRVFLRVSDSGLMLCCKYLVMQSSKKMPACLQCPAETWLCRMKGCSW